VSQGFVKEAAEGAVLAGKGQRKITSWVKGDSKSMREKQIRSATQQTDRIKSKKKQLGRVYAKPCDLALFLTHPSNTSSKERKCVLFRS
jgi:hypothetical protein